jgi:hypothetical protein
MADRDKKIAVLIIKELQKKFAASHLHEPKILIQGCGAKICPGEAIERTSSLTDQS